MSREKRPDKPSVELTEAEWAIMRAIWRHQPCAAGTVQEALAASKGWAYSTVKTTMDRMVRKGLLRIQTIRNLNLYSTTVGEVEAKRGEFRRMLQRAFDGAIAPMMQFLVEHEGLSAEEALQLREMSRRMIQTAKSGRADGPRGREAPDGRDR
ncbi:MAG TPA: BlaI/MecI/CopY family transcriptional regulator [Sedimentisphaerales bacterium]|jgi:predicted transcriptional regulator|nr:BlaI/MecI/CopY family transcriptional regulator [Sedimentisphaerales bacterium]HNU28992.1 BlaI/MecI/CopY family transcriptional regulator [Sedimentisphaerales bacterium]